MSTAEDRAKYIEGLRQLAAVLQAHPEIPLPTQGNLLAIGICFMDGDGSDRERMAAAARAFPCDWGKRIRDGGEVSYFELDGLLAGGLKVSLSAFRETICTRKVVGTEDHEVEVVITPAVTQKVVKPVEVVEWTCGPVLGKALSEPMRDQS